MMTNDATTGEGIDPGELLDTLEIRKVERRSSAGGAWVTGRMGGYRFVALVFPESALNREWEVNGDSRISKLWISDADGREMYAWDRGPGTPPANATVEMVVGLLAEGLAETIFENREGLRDAERCAVPDARHYRHTMPVVPRNRHRLSDMDR